MGAKDKASHPDDLVVWPDGFSAIISELHGGEFNHRSDDFQVVSHEDHVRMRELRFADKITT